MIEEKDDVVIDVGGSPAPKAPSKPATEPAAEPKATNGSALVKHNGDAAPPSAMTVAEVKSIGQLDPYRFEPYDAASLMDACAIACKSGLVPTTKPETAWVIAKTGSEYGLAFMQSFRMIYTVDGKPAFYAAFVMALVKRSKLCEYFVCTETTRERCTFTTQRKGDPIPQSLTWTIQDAIDAGLAGKNNWKKDPAAMLRARCSMALGRMVYPEVAAGMYDPDELEGDVYSPVVQRFPQREVEAPPDPQAAAKGAALLRGGLFGGAPMAPPEFAATPETSAEAAPAESPPKPTPAPAGLPWLPK